MSDWPDPNDYTAAVQNPQICFRDPELRGCAVQKHPLTRMPKVWTGNFAQVYELTNANGRWAVKCFTRSSRDLRERYGIISSAIAATRLPYFVHFRLLDEEVLVNGRRYPIVKMEWIDGLSFEKYVEANLYRSPVLLELASRLMRMVKDLESYGLAHGDLQHGNILVRGPELKVVDYDGMFVPAFKGTLSPERGLPSYQHPRRDERLYNATLDRFALLVMCTGLCALAAVPSLWYEFNTGDNLLFGKEDFENPERSPLFARLASITDYQVVAFLEMLKAACLQPPYDILYPQKSVLVTPPQARQLWWVPATTAPRPAPQQKLHWSVALTAIFMEAMLVLYLTDVLRGALAACLSLSAAVLYVVERYYCFKNLPVFRRRRDLSTRIKHLKEQLTLTQTEHSNLQNEPQRLLQREAQEKAGTLKDLQEKEVAEALSKIDISRLTEIKGIGPYLVGNLTDAGIFNGHQLRQKGAHGVRGIGPIRHGQITDILSTWEAQAKRQTSKTLPPAVESKIASKYLQQRQAVVNQLSSIGHKIGAIRGETSLSQRELTQLCIPRFGQFLKHNF